MNVTNTIQCVALDASVIPVNSKADKCTIK